MTLRQRLGALARQRMSPRTLALSVALGVLLGVFPVYGCPTLLCAAAAAVLRLNLPAMQLVNVLTSPLQLALLGPFARLGGRMLHLTAGAPAPSGVWRMALWLGAAALHAVAGWISIAAPLGILVYLAVAMTRSELREGEQIA